jgi:hypothetical protein
MHSNQKSERSSESNRLGPSTVRVPSATLHVRFTDSGRRGCGWGCASRLLILRVAVDDPAPSTPPRCRAAAVLYAAVRSHHGPDLYTRWGSPVASPSRSSGIAMVLSPGGPRLRPCLAGKICFQLSCSEALCDYYNSTGHPTCRPESVYLKP